MAFGILEVLRVRAARGGDAIDGSGDERNRAFEDAQRASGDVAEHAAAVLIAAETHRAAFGGNPGEGVDLTVGLRQRWPERDRAVQIIQRVMRVAVL